MNILSFRVRPSSSQRRFGIQFTAILVALHGLFILITTLLEQLAARRGSHLSDISIDLPLLIGLSLLYFSTLLRRLKRTAWLVTVGAYAFYLALNIINVLNNNGLHRVWVVFLTRGFVIPIAILLLLTSVRKEFIVRSDTQGFRRAARFSVIILLIAFFYGVGGFLLFDESDFHQEIQLSSAVHYTVDQFDLTTTHPVRPYTKRAHLFVDSLSVVSIGAVGYAMISLFQPLRSRFSDQTSNREKLTRLLEKYHAPSEDFFKLWPHDKQYFFDSSEVSGLALHVKSGVALCLGDPVGRKSHFKQLLEEFNQFCYNNDWLPAFIHVENSHRSTYELAGYTLQKLGQEAIVDIERYQSSVARNKYFRHIRNKFTKQEFSAELLQPPYHAAVIDRLRQVSNDWLSKPGRVERGFVMGYFNEEYIQQCPVVVVRDAAGTIQAFLNQIPAPFDPEEATFDMMRHANGSISNINDFLLMHFIAELHAAGFKRINLGLCPLIGLDETDDERKTLIDSVLQFAYANGDRFYSFSGLYRFKSKYEPEWRDRYIAYQSGVRGFTRTMNALMRTMRVKRPDRSS